MHILFCKCTVCFFSPLFHFGPFPCPPPPQQSHILIFRYPFSQLFLLAQFFLIWNFYVKGPTFKFARNLLANILHTTSHLTNSSQSCSYRASAQKPQNRTGSTNYINGNQSQHFKFFVAIFWVPTLPFRLFGSVACKETGSSMITLSNSVSPY